MFAVVLVGGFGTRLRPLTNQTPKPMLPIVRRPMIERLVERLGAGGVTDVVLALGFQPDPFRSVFPDHRYGSMRIHYAVEPEPLDTAGAIAFAARQVGIESTFLAVNGDIVSQFDPASFVEAHQAGGGLASIHLTPVDDPSAFGVVELDGSQVRRFVEKPSPGETDSNLINAGSYLLEPAALEGVADGAACSIERDVFPELVERGVLTGFPTDSYWIDTGRPELYLAANLDLLDGRSGPAEPGVDPTAAVAPTAVIERSVIDRDVVVGAGATVRDSVMLPGARVGADAAVVDSIVDGSVGDGAQLDRAVVGAGADVAAGTSLIDARLPS